MEIEKNKIKDIKEFCKLFKIPIPYEKEFEYYIETLKKSKEYFYLPRLVEEFIAFERWTSISEYSNVSHYKTRYAMDTAIEYIKNSKAYEKFIAVDYSKETFYSKDRLKENEGNLLVSFDLKSANFNTMKGFDSNIGKEFGDTWEEFCQHLDIHPFLATSKSFRQIVFGNVNPKRNQKFQHLKMLKLIEDLREKGITEEQIIFISHDEIVLGLPSKSKFREANDTRNLISTVENTWKDKAPIKSTIFNMTKIQKNVYIKEYFHIEIQPSIFYAVDGNADNFMPPLLLLLNYIQCLKLYLEPLQISIILYSKNTLSMRRLRVEIYIS